MTNKNNNSGNGVDRSGTKGNDVLVGTQFNDYLSGGRGNDYLDGGAGNDWLDGGSGNDTIVDLSGVNRIRGGDGNDSILALLSAGSNIDGDDGNDRVQLRIDGSARGASADGGDGRDTLVLDFSAQAYAAGGQADAKAYLSWLGSNGNGSCGGGHGSTFTMSNLGATLRDFESVEFRVDGVVVDPRKPWPVNNTPPVAGDDSATTNEDAPVTINVLANDSDAQSAITITSTGGAAHGSVTLNANGTLTYTPTANFNGTDSFTYVVRDAQGATDTASVSINVRAVNDAPVAAADAATVAANAVVSIAVLANDGDIDAGDTKALTGFDTQGTRGTVSIVDGAALYDPHHAFDNLYIGQHATDSFSYTMVDSGGLASSARVTVTVNGTKLLPLFTNGDDVVDFNTLPTGLYDPATFHNALAGNDYVVLPLSPEAAARIGYDLSIPFRGGLGSDIVIGGAAGGGANFSDAIGPLTIDLNLGTATGLSGDVDTLFGVNHVVGSGFADVMNGNADSNWLEAGAGNDILSGGVGDDILTGGLGDDNLLGGEGYDTADYSDAPGAIVVTTATLSVTGPVGNDTFSDIEQFSGTAFDDVMNAQGTTEDWGLLGAGGNDLILGGSGHEYLDGGVGRDRIEGGDGDDLIVGGDGDDELYGQAGDDLLVGGIGNDLLFGDAGIDIFIDEAGNDILDGGSDFDLADYFEAKVAVNVDLTTGRATSADDNDTFISIEGASGSNYADVITAVGSTANRYLNGAAGDDLLTGGSGDDVIVGGRGSDTLVGGGGADTFEFDLGGAPEVDVIDDFDIAGGDRIDLRPTGLHGMDELLIEQMAGYTAVHLSSVLQVALHGVAASDLTSDQFVFA